MPTRYEDLFAIAQDIEHFSSREILVAPVAPPPGVDPETIPFYGVRAPPISSDPPEHTWTRKMLLPHFSIKAVTPYEEETRELCNRADRSDSSRTAAPTPPSTTPSRSRLASSPRCSAPART